MEMNLTPEEREFLRKYQKLDSYDRFRVRRRIDELTTEQQERLRKSFELYKEPGATRKE